MSALGTYKRQNGGRIVDRLRQSAIQVVENGVRSRTEAAKFDEHREAPQGMRTTLDDVERDNGVAQYPGPDIEHIGNGSGGPRR